MKHRWAGGLASILIAGCGLAFVCDEARAQQWSSWRFIESTDPFDDRSVSWYLETSRDRIIPQFFSVFCTEEIAGVAISDGYLYSYHIQPLRIRVDDLEAWTFDVYHYHRASHRAMSNELAQRAVDELRAGQRQLIYAMRNDVLTVPLSGSTRAAQQFADACPHIDVAPQPSVLGKQ